MQEDVLHIMDSFQKAKQTNKHLKRHLDVQLALDQTTKFVFKSKCSLFGQPSAMKLKTNPIHSHHLLYMQELYGLCK